VLELKKGTMHVSIGERWVVNDTYMVTRKKVSIKINKKPPKRNECQF
jgi:hypothetical protein